MLLSCCPFVLLMIEQCNKVLPKSPGNSDVFLAAMTNNPASSSIVLQKDTAGKVLVCWRLRLIIQFLSSNSSFSTLGDRRNKLCSTFPLHITNRFIYCLSVTSRIWPFRKLNSNVTLNGLLIIGVDCNKYARPWLFHFPCFQAKPFSLTDTTEGPCTTALTVNSFLIVV